MQISLSTDMNAWLANVLQGLVSSALYSLFGQLFGFGRKYLAKDVEAKIYDSISSANLESVIGFGPLAEGAAEELQTFLSSAEATMVVRQIYSFRLTESKNGGLDSIRSEFIKLLQVSVRGADDKLARSLFRTILGACDDALSAAVTKGSMVAAEAKATSRHRILMDELAALNHNLELLSSKPNIQDILDFEKRYRDQVATRHDSISPPHLDRQKKFPLDSLYVAPNLTRYVTTGRQWVGRHQDSIDTEYLLSTIHRAVILGNPGAGKSTFAQKLCHDLSTSSRFAGRNVTPVLVVLRDYGAYKKEHNSSILSFIETRSAAWYQVSAPPRAFDYLFLNGRAFVIFDGLDELLDTGYRREIGDDIE